MANSKNIDVTSTGIQPSNYEKGQDVIYHFQKECSVWSVSEIGKKNA